MVKAVRKNESSRVLFEVAARNEKNVRKPRNVTFNISVSHQPMELFCTNAGERRVKSVAVEQAMIILADRVWAVAKPDILKRIAARK